MELKQEDLFNDCEYCGGSGKEPSRTSEDSIQVTSEGDCKKCGGKRIVLTELGETLKNFFGKLKQTGMI